MKFSLVKSDPVQDVYRLEGKVLEPGLFTKILYGLTGMATTAAFVAPAHEWYIIPSITFGVISLFGTGLTAATTREVLNGSIAENKDIFTRKNRKNFAKDGNREVVSHHYTVYVHGKMLTAERFQATYERTIVAFRENGKLKFEKILTEMPQTTWENAFSQLAKDDGILFEEGPRSGFDWKERKKELGMLDAEIRDH